MMASAVMAPLIQRNKVGGIYRLRENEIDGMLGRGPLSSQWRVMEDELQRSK